MKIRSDRGSAPAAESEQTIKKENGKAKILEEIGKNGKLANNDVENLLGVSDATATRYLDELEKEGKLRQVGETGRGAHYTSTT